MYRPPGHPSPQAGGTCAQYEHMNNCCPASILPWNIAHYTRGERRMKNYNGLVQLEVNRLSGHCQKAEYVKQQAALLPQTCRFLRFQRTECQNMGIICPARQHRRQRGELICHLVSCHAFTVWRWSATSFAVCHYIERILPLPEVAAWLWTDIHTTILPLYLSAWNSPSACRQRNSQKRIRCCASSGQ